MDWRGHIQSDPHVLGGKPVVRGTRLSVEYLLDLMAAGWTREQLLQEFPSLSPEALTAVLGCAAESFRDVTFGAFATSVR